MFGSLDFPRAGVCAVFLTAASAAWGGGALGPSEEPKDAAAGADDDKPPAETPPAPGHPDDPIDTAAYRGVRDFDSLCVYAEELTRTPFAPAPPLPDGLKDLDYDAYRRIAFWPNEAYWRRSGTPFQLETFHRGYIFFERVRVHLLHRREGGVVREELPFEPRRYEYRGKDLFESIGPGGPGLKGHVGHAGLKVLGTLPGSPYMQEIGSFLGASYFRSLSEGQVYGTSCRGLGVNMGMPQPEEFPCFRDFWVVTPEARDEDGDREFDGPPGSGELTVLAAMDSPSLTGAYEFRLRPGHATEVDVRAKLFFRHKPPKLCLAPMSSMWMWGDGKAPPGGEARPKVHDADGLLTLGRRGDGEGWTFRPLAKQSYPSVSSQKFTDLRGFGLLQRDRDFDHYRDREAKYDRRPSVWIQPLDEKGHPGSWGAGFVELFEMPADHEGLDNIACWFVPEAEYGPGTPFATRYRVSFPSGDVPGHETGRAVATRVHRDGGATLVEVDFEGVANHQSGESDPGDAGSSYRPGSLTARVSAGAGSVEELTLVSATEADSSQGRVTLRFRFRRPENAGPEAPTELRAQLLSGGRPVAETWRYLCPPN